MVAEREILGDDEACTYLPAETARMRYRVIDGCPPARYQAMLARGWRRFGRVFFRPACTACDACRGLRVAVDDFAPNRSMQRTVRRNEDLEVELTRPTITRDHLALYARYHEARHEDRGWPLRQVDPFDYHQSFVEGAAAFGHELRFWHGDTLVAVALVDRLPQALSAVYCYYDPERRKRALGVFSVLQQITLARRWGIPHLYLGYWVEANPSMRYKARYRPHTLIDGRPEDDEPPRWRAPEHGRPEPP